MKEAKTQQEFEELSKLGEWFYVTSGSWVANGSSHVVARDSSHVEAWGSSHVVARGSSHVVAWGSSHVEAFGSSHVEANGSSHVEAFGSSHVEANGSSHVEAHSPYVSIIAKSPIALLSGGYIVGNKPLTPREWLSACSVPIKRGKVTLFKSLKEDWTTQNGVSFKVGEITAAPDWDATFTEECGKGLHFSPTVAQAKSFRDNGTFIACEVAVKDIAGLPAFAAYPDKIRARACKVLYQVNREGEKIK